MSEDARPYLIAIIGAGPSGIYAAEALVQQTEVPVEVVVIERLPVPFGLVRYGVAPDHPSIRSIRNTLERTLERSGVSFFGDVTIGRDLSIDELRDRTDAVVYAYGAGSDRRLRIEGEQLPGSIAAPEFVAWYCGHPDVHPDTDHPDTDHPDTDHPDTDQPEPFSTDLSGEVERLLASTTSAVVVGVGNVALDVTRVLIKSAEELSPTDMAEEVLAVLDRNRVTDVHLLGRRGPVYTAFTTKELRELGQLDDVDLVVDPDDFVLDESSSAVLGVDKVAARNVAVMRGWLDRPTGQASRRIHFHFWTRPTRLVGHDRVEAVEIERTRIDADGGIVGTGVTRRIPAQLVVRSVGYQGTALPGAPYDESTGRVPHAEGRVIRDGAFSPDEYVTGWIKRGPTGVIGTNKSDAVETVTSLLTDIADEAITRSHELDELRDLLAARNLHPLEMPAWHRIDAAEIERGVSHGRQRTTLAHRSDLLAAAEDQLSGDPELVVPRFDLPDGSAAVEAAADQPSQGSGRS